jgi:hypothetical protein
MTPLGIEPATFQMTFGYWVYSRYGEIFKIGTEVKNLGVVTSGLLV